MTKPIVHQNSLYDLLRAEQIEEFNKRKGAGESTEGKLAAGDFRGLDLRNLDADGLNLSDAYFRGADLRGIDFKVSIRRLQDVSKTQLTIWRFNVFGYTCATIRKAT